MGEAKRKGQVVHVDGAKYFREPVGGSGLSLYTPMHDRSPPWLLLLAAVAAVAIVTLWALSAFAQAASQPVAPVVPQDWQKQLLELAGAALLAGLTYASAAIKAYFAAHAKGAVGNYALGVYQRLDAAVQTAVTSVEQQTLRDFATGVTKKNAAQAKADAVAYVKSYLGAQGLAELASIVGLDQVATVISGKIESAVLQVNQPAAAAAVAVAAK